MFITAAKQNLGAREGVATSLISQCLTSLSIAPAVSGGVFLSLLTTAGLQHPFPLCIHCCPPFPCMGMQLFLYYREVLGAQSIRGSFTAGALRQMQTLPQWDAGLIHQQLLAGLLCLGAAVLSTSTSPRLSSHSLGSLEMLQLSQTPVSSSSRENLQHHPMS